jgi:hypothetical protein
MHNGKWKITVQNTRKMSVLASLRFSIKCKMSEYQLILHNQHRPSARFFFFNWRNPIEAFSSERIKTEFAAQFIFDNIEKNVSSD